MKEEGFFCLRRPSLPPSTTSQMCRLFARVEDEGGRGVFVVRAGEGGRAALVALVGGGVKRRTDRGKGERGGGGGVCLFLLPLNLDFPRHVLFLLFFTRFF